MSEDRTENGQEAAVERDRAGEAEGEAQASGLDNWVNVIRFLRCGIQQEKGMCGREDLRIRDGACFSQGDLAP